MSKWKKVFGILLMLPLILIVIFNLICIIGCSKLVVVVFALVIVLMFSYGLGFILDEDE